MLTEALGLIASLSMMGFFIVVYANIQQFKKIGNLETKNSHLIASSDEWQNRYNKAVERIKDLECEKSSMMTRMMVNSSVTDSGSMIQDSSHIQ